MAVPNFSELENKLLADWQAKDIFRKTLSKEAPQGNFVFFEGPPTANGLPHMGHVETRAFKDVILRYKTMRGFHVERKAGWDTQGLPVELEIEKKLGISGKKEIEAYGIAKFNAEAKASVWKYKELWEKMSARVGFWLETKDPYITYSNDYIETLWWIFKQAWDQDLLKQDYKVVPYCPRCGTALSSHEVAQGYQLVKDTSVYVKFELVDEPGTFVLAWTTTPWTLPGNVALAVGKKIKYLKVKYSNNNISENFILAEAAIPKVFSHLSPQLESKLNHGGLNPQTSYAVDSPDDGHTSLEILEEVSTDKLIGKSYKPLFDFLDLREEAKKARISEPAGEESQKLKSVKAAETLRSAQGFEKAYIIVSADFVTTDDGTGVVHTAVMYGEDDFQLGHKLDLPKVHTVDLQGKFNELVKPWVGWKVKDSDPAVEGKTTKTILAYLSDHNKLYKTEKYEHDYPFCWRCKHPLLYYAKTSWFILMSKLREQLMTNNEKINWYPNHIKDGRFGEWLREVKDWAISRERYWGTPLPIWQCDNPTCKHQECLGSYAEVAAKVSSKNTYILVRHGQSTNNVSGTLDTVLEDGSADLTDLGRTQAAAAAKELRGRKVDYLYSSQFTRAQQTADIIAKELGLTVTTEAEINEYRIGPRYEGKTVQEFHEKFGDRADRLVEAPEGGETWTDIQRRFISFLQELEAKHEGKTIVLVTHADPILVALWTMSFKPESEIANMSYPKNGEPVDLHFPATMFTATGEFDPHRPFIDDASYRCVTCKTGTMKRVPEVADTWFDSGSMPFAQWHYPFENNERIDKGISYPAGYISEAIDQTRGWFYTLLAISTLLQKEQIVKEPPFQNVVVLGHIRDKEGKKLSKSLGNYIDPMDLIEQKSADAVRFYLFTMNQPGDPKNFDPAGVDEVIKKTFLILMNVVSFWRLTKTETDADPDQSIHPLDRWIHSLLNQLVDDVTKRLDVYDITGAGRAISAFVTDLSTWYVRRSRDRMKGEEAPMASAVLRHVLLKLSRLMAPFTPFLADYIYQTLGGEVESVHLAEWPKVGTIDEQLLVDMTAARGVVEEGHSLRAASKLKVRQPLQQVVTITQLRPDLDDIVKDELNVKEVHAGQDLPTGSEWAKGMNVALDTTITDELKEEGLYRDLIREFNALRKSAKLQPADEIHAFCQPKTMAAQIIERFSQEFLREIKAVSVTPSTDGASHLAEIRLGGETITIGLSRK